VSPRAYVALGSNLGDRVAHLALARRRLAMLERTRLLGASAVEDTLPLEQRKQPSYLNQMVALETLLTPAGLLDACHAVEREAGRERRERGGSRTLDLDLVTYQGMTMATERLTLPHPGLGARPFWQRELAELERMGL
jgi:2-amino-4-hydroxy-6-hydroxymethyldihydropteridine diphosphokinase